MKKKQFLKILRQNLQTHKDVDKIIKEYEKLIDDKIASGLKEKEAVSYFGSPENLAQEILKKQNNDIIGAFSKRIIDFFEQLINTFINKTPSELILMIFEILLVILLLCLCHLPINILINVGKSVFYILSSPLNQLFYLLWKFVLEIAYIVISFTIFINFIKKRFLKKTKEVQKKIDNTNIVAIFAIFFKFLAIILLFFVSVYLVFISVILFFCLYLLFQKITYFGFYLVMLALFILGLLFFQLLFNFVLEKKIKRKNLLITLIITIIILICGCFLATFEVASTTFVNEPPQNLKVEELNEEIPFNNQTILVGNINDFIIDENIKDIKIIYRYYNVGTRLKTKIRKNANEVFLEWQFHEFHLSHDLIQHILTDLQEKKLYNYYLEPQIIVKTNSNNMKYIKQNRQRYYHSFNYSSCEFIRTYKVLDIIKDKNNLYTYLTLTSPLDDDIYTVKLSNALTNDVVKNNYYEFTFKTYQSFIDTDIEDVFKDNEVIKITKTDKSIINQIEDNSCSVFY